MTSSNKVNTSPSSALSRDQDCPDRQSEIKLTPDEVTKGIRRAASAAVASLRAAGVSVYTIVEGKVVEVPPKASTSHW